MTRKLMLFGVLAVLPVICTASNITLQGNFTADDNAQLFSVALAAPAAVDFRSYGYAGGTTSTGTVVPTGGFDTVLTLFSSSGVFINDNDDGAGVPTDPATGLLGDARITANLAAGSYTLVLTQYDNFSIGNLSDGFVEAGKPNFTADPSFTSGGACPGNTFRDISGTAGRCRTGNWSIDFVGASSVTPVAPVPEPSALLIVGLGLALFLVFYLRRRMKALLAGGLLAAFASVAVQAQTTCPPVSSGPDYCPVQDFLNGQRTLLPIQDLEVIDLGNNASQGQITQLKTSSSSPPAVNQFLPGWTSNEGAQVKSFSARMFNQKRATTFSSLYDFDHTGLFTLWLQSVDGVTGDGLYWRPLPGGQAPGVLCGAAADFAQSGHEELALGLTDGRVLILAPNNVNDANAGFKSSFNQLDFLNDMTAGDFRGDGQHEIAGLIAGPNGGLGIVVYSVDPHTLAATRAGSLIINPPDASSSTPVVKLSVARGRFSGVNHDQLAVAFATNSGLTHVEIVDFTANADGTLTPFEASPRPLFSPDSAVFSGGYMQVKTGKFGLLNTKPGAPTTAFDQIVFHSSSSASGGRYLEVLQVNPSNLTISGTTQLSYGSFPGAIGIQVGNFAQRLPDGANPDQTQPNPNSQIALLLFTIDSPYEGLTNVYYTMNVYTVDPVTFDIDGSPATQNLNFTENNGAANAIGPLNVSFVATDLQGRSISLGEPLKVTLHNASQPTAIIGVPPMHIDYVSPPNGTPELLNLSFVWDGYSATYQQVDDVNKKTSTSNTTSWTFGAEESGTASLTIGDPNNEGLKVSDTAKAAQSLKGSSGNTHGTYEGQNYNFTAQTGIDDFIDYVNSDFNIWIYPVIGQTVCPSDGSACKPLTVQFSAATGNPTVTTAEGFSLPWYQPPWEPGNILSYPGNLVQLTAAFPNLTPLNDTQTSTFFTDSTTSSRTTTWTTSTSQTPVTSLNQNYSFDNKLSVTSGVSFGAGSVSGGYDLDVNGSVAFESLTSHTTTLGQSAGLVIDKPGTFTNPQTYSYAVTPYIFGVTQPGGVVDNQQLPGDIHTFGFLSAMYSVAPSFNQTWWSATYGQAPDIALNHPARWTKGYNKSAPAACIGNDCPVLAQPSPDLAYADNFHWMRGLFISNATSPGKGPQLEQVTKGGKLSLQARVHNYSSVIIPSNVARAAFYVAPFGGKPEQAVLIQTVTLPAIPPFDPTGNALNWLLTPAVTFDTADTKYAALLPSGQQSSGVMFYVVVWMEDSNMKLLTELPFHGLTAMPPPSGGSDPTPSLAAWIKNEDNFSNNVGLYYQEISVVSLPEGVGAPSPLPTNPASITVGKVKVSDNHANIGDRVLLTATLSATGATAGVNMEFFDGDPADGGRLFRMNRIPYIGSDTQRLIQTFYQPATCGLHELFAIVNRGQPAEVKRRAQPVHVACSANQ